MEATTMKRPETVALTYDKSNPMEIPNEVRKLNNKYEH